jgi:hypothetical protein
MFFSSTRDPEETSVSVDANAESNKAETKDDDTTKPAATAGDEPVPEDLPVPVDAKRSAPTAPMLTKPLKKGRTAYFIFADVKRAEVQAAVRSRRWPLKHVGCIFIILGLSCDKTNAWSGYSDSNRNLQIYVFLFIIVCIL